MKYLPGLHPFSISPASLLGPNLRKRRLEHATNIDLTASQKHRNAWSDDGATSFAAECITPLHLCKKIQH